MDNEQTVGNFTGIQFIGMCICATPGDLESIEEMSDNGVYLGLPDTQQDIQARIKMVTESIAKAASNAAMSSNVLKVFVIPEFFFRGDRGAYLIGQNGYLTPYQFFTSQYGALLRFISDPKYSDWLFVFGTQLTTTSAINKAAEPTKSLYPLGDHLLDVYHRLHPQGLGDASVNGQSLRSMLRAIDEEQSGDTDFALSADLPYRAVLKSTLDYCDLTARIEVDNSCFAVPGGVGKMPYRVLKKYKSKEDFILNSTYKSKETGYLQSITKYSDIQNKPEGEYKTSVTDPYAVFTYGGIVFGIDICLDHSRRRLHEHLKKTSKYVDVQIVTSCGMDVRPNAVIARLGGWVFNCDGEYVLNDPTKANDGEHSHTSLMRVTKAITADENSVATLSVNQQRVAKLPMKADTRLYPYANFDLHIYTPMSLSITDGGDEAQ